MTETGTECSAAQRCTVQYSTVQYSAIQHSRVQHSTVQYLHISVHGYYSPHTGGGLWTAYVGVSEEELPAQVALLNMIHVCDVHGALAFACPCFHT